MSETSRFDFPVVSGGEVHEAAARLGDATFGDVAVREEQVFEHIGGDWRHGEWGEQIGTLTLKDAPTTVPGRSIVHATFVFDDGDVVEFVGLAPGKGSWKGKGRFAYRAGTGKFASPRGELPVDSTNPKLWG